MFSFTKLKTISLAAVTALSMLVLMSSYSSAQQDEFERRAEAMRHARSRQVVPARFAAANRGDVARTTDQVEPAVRRTSSQGVSNTAPPAPTRVARAPRATRSSKNGYRVAHAAGTGVSRTRSGRTAILPRVAQNLAPSVVVDGVGETIVDGSYGGEVYYEGSPGCDSCGEPCAYFEEGCDVACGGGPCCGRGGCPPGDCWLAGLGGLLRNGEYFFGAAGFQEPVYTAPGSATANPQQVQDSSFGFYGGVNFGAPLCRLTCGVLSGQIGVRSVQTNFSGNEFTNESRDQLFVTAGLYRRVDYGFQFGVVGDFLQDEFYGDASVSQIRTDLGWVYAGGSTIGFRYTGAQDDDLIDVSFNGIQFPNGQNVEVHDQYRFYYRWRGNAGGFGEAFAGWTEFDQTILGMDFDVPLNNCVAIESNFTYFFSDDAVQDVFIPTNFQGANANEAWNISVGFVFRPQGRRFYNNYDRPLFDVADNGTMLLRRGN